MVRGAESTTRPTGLRFSDGVRLALTTLTIARLRGGRVDRDTARVAMSLAPAVGLLLGGVVAAIALGLRGLGATPLVAAVAVVAACAVLTRGLHLDGLADTADGLGAYADREKALEIMRRPDIGPFGVVTLVLVLLAQVAAASAVLVRPSGTAAVGIIAAIAAGRVGIALACRRRVPPARPDGMGAVVAGTVAPLTCALWTLALLAFSVLAVPDRPWQGPLAVALGIGAGLLLVWHAVRRLGGVTGDVLGATTEISVTATFIVISM